MSVDPQATKGSAGVRVLGVVGVAVLIVVTLTAYGLSAMATDPCGTRADDPDCYRRATAIGVSVLAIGAGGIGGLVATTLWPKPTRPSRTRSLGLLFVPGAMLLMLVPLSTPLN